MAATSSRTLRLLSLLQSRRSWGGTELADRLDVSLRTLRRDVDRLRELGYPVQARPGVAGGYELTRGASLPPLVLDDDEAVAIAVGLTGAARAGVAGLAEASVQALAKVVPVMPSRLRRRIDALRTATAPGPGEPGHAQVDPDLLVALALACRDTERVAFTHRRDDGGITDRVVEPAALVPLGARWYLLAWDLDRVDWRIFRLDRLAGATPTGTRFVPRTPPGGDVAAWVRSRVTERPDSTRVDAVVAAPADVVRARVPRWMDVEPDGEDRCHVRFDVFAGDELWAVGALVVLGADVTALSPAHLLVPVREVADRLARTTVG